MDWLVSIVIPLCLLFGKCEEPAIPVPVPPRVLRLGDCIGLDRDVGAFACRRQR